MSVTLVWRTDLHLSDHTPSSRTDNWTETVLGKIAKVGRIAGEVGADAVLDGGDYFDIKSPVRNSHELVRRSIAVHRAYPCPVYANVGNHDCVYGDYSFLPQQPLGVLYESGTFRRLYDEHEALFEDAEGYRVRVVGVPYHGVRYDDERFRRIERKGEDLLVAVAHLLASPTKTKMFEGEDIVRYDRLDAFAPDLWFFGHWHEDQGISRTPGGKTVVNLGSLTRGALSQDSLERDPSVAILRAGRDGVTIDRRSIEAAPPADIFTLEARERKDLRDEILVKMVDSLAVAILPSVQTPLRDVVRDLDGVPDRVRETTLDYLERAETR